MRTTIDIVLPAYNPHSGWEDDVIDNYGALCNHFSNYSFTLHIVTDGAVKGYEDMVIEKLRSAFPDVDIIDYRINRGKGYALREAVKHCYSDYIIYTDYDFPYTRDSLYKVIEALLGGADIVIAVRDSSYGEKLPPFRKFLSSSSHLFNHLLFGGKIHDTQGGLKGFNRKGRELFLSTTIDSFLFDTQFIYKAVKRGDVRIEMVNTSVREGIRISGMGMKVFLKESLNLYQLLFK